MVMGGLEAWATGPITRSDTNPNPGGGPHGDPGPHLRRLRHPARLAWRRRPGGGADLRPVPAGSRRSAFARAWRDRYQPGWSRSAGRPAVPDLDTLHAESLEGVLGRAHLGEAVPPEARRELVLAWHRLDAWPEVPGRALPGCCERYLLAPCSNAHVRLAMRMRAATVCPGTRCSGPSSPGLQAEARRLSPRRRGFAVRAGRGDDGGGPFLRSRGGRVLRACHRTRRAARRERPGHRRAGAPGSGGCRGVGPGGSGAAARLLRNARLSATRGRK